MNVKEYIKINYSVGYLNEETLILIGDENGELVHCQLSEFNIDGKHSDKTVKSIKLNQNNNRVSIIV